MKSAYSYCTPLLGYIINKELTSIKKFICKDTSEIVLGYHNYLKTEHWKKVKERYIESKLPKKCYICGYKNKLQLHHKTYKHVGNERLSDLVYLCDVHHKDVHHALTITNKSLWDVARYIKKQWRKKQEKTGCKNWHKDKNTSFYK